MVLDGKFSECKGWIIVVCSWLRLSIVGRHMKFRDMLEKQIYISLGGTDCHDTNEVWWS